MTDEELMLAMAELQEVVRCRCDEAYRDRGLKDPHCECDSAEAVKVVADRIEALTKERDEAVNQQDSARHSVDVLEKRGRAMIAENAKLHDRIEALTKERDEQIEWVKRLADDLIAAEAKLATCEKYRDAYDEMGRIGTQAVRDLEAKLTLMMTERDEAWKRAAYSEKMWGEAEVKLEKAKAPPPPASRIRAVLTPKGGGDE